MKTIFALTASALMLMTAGVASAETKTLFGCEMTKAANGNYFFKTDAGCQFSGINGSDAYGAEAPADK